MSVLTFYIVVNPSHVTKRYGQVVTLDLWQDKNMAQLDSIFNDCIQIYPRAGQPDDPDKVVLVCRFGNKIQKFLADQCGSDNPFYNPDAVQMLDVYNQFFGSLETLKAVWPDLAETIDIEYQDEDGNTLTKTVPIMNEDHCWAE